MICRPTQFRNLKFGHPVIFPKKYFEELKLSEGDLGARKIVNENKNFLIHMKQMMNLIFLI